jgi:hypothetical protein
MSPYSACGEHSINNAVRPNSMETDQMINTAADTTLKLKFYDIPLDSFCFYIRNEYPVTADKALDILFPFVLYLYESEFSTFSTSQTTKMKSRER